MRKRAAVSSLLVLLSLASSEAGAADRRVVIAARTSTPPVIDGRIDDEVWTLAPAITGLRQQRPDNGEPASEEIEIHVLYDDSAIYVGAVMQHKNSKVVRLLARRDTFLESEWFGIMLDSQHDRRSAFTENGAIALRIERPQCVLCE